MRKIAFAMFPADKLFSLDLGMSGTLLPNPLHALRRRFGVIWNLERLGGRGIPGGKVTGGLAQEVS
jgi:hypothetical protein